MFRYFAIYKPFGMLSQFTTDGKNPSLAGLEYKFPKDVYPVGRLDSDSEGLLLLTNDPRINHKLLSPAALHWRKYLVQVEGDISTEAIETLEKGVELSIDGKKIKTAKCKAKILSAPPEELPERIPPVRFRKSIPTSWIEISLSEGKNRQVRKMTASVGFPALRLIRLEIEKLSLQKMQPGNVEEIEKQEFYEKLRLN